METFVQNTTPHFDRPIISAAIVVGLLCGTLLFAMAYAESNASSPNSGGPHMHRYSGDLNTFCRDFTENLESAALAFKDDSLWAHTLCAQPNGNHINLIEVRQHDAVGISHVTGYGLTYNALAQVDLTVESLCKGQHTVALVYDIQEDKIMRAAPICETPQGLTLYGAIGSA